LGRGLNGFSKQGETQGKLRRKKNKAGQKGRRAEKGPGKSFKKKRVKGETERGGRVFTPKFPSMELEK